jgi:hypothetical protein
MKTRSVNSSRTTPIKSVRQPLKTLERVLSKAGRGSRTQARKWIGAGRVAVNGKVIRTPDHWVDMQRDRVMLDGQPVQTSRRIYLLLYKPKGYLTTYKDPEGRTTVYELLRDFDEYVFPVGRLDLDTSGLLLLTNDAQFAERITNPIYKIPKTYLVKASTRLTDEQLDLLRRGVALRERVRRENIFRNHDLGGAQSPGAPDGGSLGRQSIETGPYGDRSAANRRLADRKIPATYCRGNPSARRFSSDTQSLLQQPKNSAFQKQMTAGVLWIDTAVPCRKNGPSHNSCSRIITPS